MLRLRRHVFGVRGASLGQNGLRQGRGPSPRRRRVHRFRRHVLPHAPEGLRRTSRPRHPLHPYRPGLEWESRHETDRSRRGVVALHRGQGASGIPRPAAVGPQAQARSGGAQHPRMGGIAQSRLGNQGAHAVAPRRLSRGVRSQGEEQWRARALGARRQRAQPDRLRHPLGAWRQDAGQEQIDADRGMRHASVPRDPRRQGDRDRSRRTHPAARRRAAEPYRRSRGPQAARRCLGSVCQNHRDGAGQ